MATQTGTSTSKVSTEKVRTEQAGPVNAGGTASAPPPKPSRSYGKVARLAGPPALLVVLVLAVSAVEPSFLGPGSLKVIAVQAVAILLLGLGEMFVILVGGIDLSAAAMASFTGVLLATWLPSLGFLAVVLTVVCGTAAGLLAGAIAAYAQVPSFIVTLGALGFWAAIAQTVSGSSTIYVSQGYGLINWLFNLGIGGIPFGVIIAVALVAVLWAVLRYARRGQSFSIVGLNEQAALMSGLPTRRIKTLAYGLSGLLASLAGIVLTAQQQSAAPGLADALLLPAIAAAVVGGCAITGGVGGPWRVLVGALIVVVLRVGSTAAGINPNYQQIVYGGVVVIAVVLTIDRSRLAIIK